MAAFLFLLSFLEQYIEDSIAVQSEMKVHFN